MAKRIYYIYNPDTDNFERAFPSIGDRLKRLAVFTTMTCMVGGLLFAIFYFWLASPSERNLRQENARLKTQSQILNRRLDNALMVMSDLQKRDDNFYRVLMQMEPMSRSQRVAGVGNENRYSKLSRMGDAQLMTQLNRNMDLLERQIYAQTVSFNQIEDAYLQQREKLNHIPSVIPLRQGEYTLAAGFGYRRDPVYGFSKYHEGLDLVAAAGQPVMATANGAVVEAGRRAAYGNFVMLDHGYNYETRYAHLKEVAVEAGDTVRRGDIIGYVGSTGQSSTPHLHYEVRYKDKPENPVNYFFMDLTPEQYDEMLNITENSGKLLD